MLSEAYHKTTLVQFDPHGSLDKQMEQFLEPVVFTQHGFESFFTNQYNTRRYIDDFLPCCFVHVLDFLAYARTTKEPRSFAIATCDLFHQRLKGSTWVNPYALLMLLEHLPDNIAPLCQSHNREEQYRKTLYDAILYDFGMLKQDPDAFLDKTTKALLAHDEEQQTIKQLQDKTTRFIESALDKLIWSPNEQIATWNTFTALGKQIMTLYDRGIIPDETALNHCIWSLVYRFSHFLDYGGRYLSENTLTEIRNDLKSETTAFLDYEEIETYVTDKRTYLFDALSRTYAQTLARKEGILP